MQNNHLLNEYKSRINKVIDYIDNNIDKQLTLDELASISNFSKFHFHRIFQAFIGETPFQFILRIKLEKAATLLLNNPSESITDIAHICGFSDISIFSRNFKNHFKQSATEWRSVKYAKSNLSKINSKTKQSEIKSSMYICKDSKTIKWRTNMKLNKSVEVKELQKTTVAYIRYIGPYKGDEKLFENLWDKLCTWAGARGLLQLPDVKFIVIYHDDPNVADEKNLRMSVCVSVPADTKVDGEVGKMEIEAGKYVFARFELNGQQFQQAWEWVYGEWFPNSGYQPADGICFELYPEEPKDGNFVVDICVPVKPM